MQALLKTIPLRPTLPAADARHWSMHSGTAAAASANDLAQELHNRTVSIHYARASMYGAQRRGEDTDALLTRVGIPLSVLAEPRARISFESFERLIHLLTQQLDDEMLGFSSNRSPYGSFGMSVHAVISCGNLHHALRRLQCFYDILHRRNPYFRFQVEGGMARILVNESALHDPGHFAREWILISMHRLAGWLIDQSIALTEVRLSYASPAHRKEYDCMFSAPLRFEAGETSLRFPAFYLELPIAQDEENMREFVDNLPHAIMWRAAPRGQRISAQVRRLFNRSEEGQHLGLSDAAARLAMSTHTLHRHLQQENLTFLAVKDAWRRDRAISLLTETSLPLREIADRTGFSDASAFLRAFKKWTGLLPSEYRSY